jgi:tryptophan aminotransferase
LCWADLAGKPNPENFPFSKISVTLKGPEEKTLVLDEAALAEALQYGLPAGHAGLIKVCYTQLSLLAPKTNSGAVV